MKQKPFALIIYILLTLSGVLLVPGIGRAQSPANTFESLTVDLWPDYDRAAVLVLLTGTLASDVSLPAEVTVPLPADATLNAVARIDSANLMIDDILFDASNAGRLTFTTPDSRFRVEYYVPYITGEEGRSFNFEWLADLTVNQILVSVQQPAAATSLTTVPAPATVTTGQDGLQYHNLPAAAVPTGQRFTAEVSYNAAGNQLSVSSLSPAQPPVSTNSGANTTVAPAETNWPLILGAIGGLLMGAAVVWWIVSNRSDARRVVKPQPASRQAARPPTRRPTTSSALPGAGAARFCHQCGAPADPDDRFCSQCGTGLKNKLLSSG